MANQEDSEPWHALAAAHREKQLQAIPEAWRLTDEKLKEISGHGTPDSGRLVKIQAAANAGLLTDKELDITEKFTAEQLLGKIAKKELLSEEVVVAFCKRAAIAQQLTSCLTEIFFHEAIARAKELDQHFHEKGEMVGPFHGLPISLKDSFIVNGQYTTLGYVESLRRPKPEGQAALANLLLDAGAVLYCKTNIPQTMMVADSHNNIFGRALNPHNTELTAGGSSGGEGTLVAFRGSPMGVGTDVGGSVRIPALCCGTYGFRPTSNRVPFGGNVYAPFPRDLHLLAVTPVAGPLANSAGDLELFMKTVANRTPWKYDASAKHLPWRAVEMHEKLTIGLVPEDPAIPLQPPVRKALASAVELLEKAGHKIVRLSQDPSRSVSLGSRISWQDFQLTFNQTAEDLEREMREPVVKAVSAQPHPFHTGALPVDEELELSKKLQALAYAREAYNQAWHKAWVDNGLDVLLSASAASTAVPHDTYGIPSYTVIWNLLDCPAAVIPFGTASKEQDPHPVKVDDPHQADYHPEAQDGTPCSIQVIAPHFRDEECLVAVRIIDRDIRS